MLETESAIDWDDLKDTPWDAIVIGAGPAGALAAHELAGAGASVLIVEKRAFPRNKICGGCLNGRALAVLRSAGLGSLVARSGGIALESLQLHLRGRSTTLPMPVGSALSRERLDAELVAAAIGQGARFLARVRAQVGEVVEGFRRISLDRGGETRTVRARVVLAASGLGGSGLPRNPPHRARIAKGARIGAGCRIPVAPPGFEEGTIFMAVAPQGYVGLVVLEDGSLNVAASLQPELVKRHGTPGMAASWIFAQAGIRPIDEFPATHWEGTPALTRQTRPIAADRLFLLGDAAGYVEPFTGEGIAWALTSGRAIAPIALRAIERWDFHLCDEWDRLHRRLVRNRQLFCRCVTAMLHRPWLAGLGFEILDRLPSAAGRVFGHLNAIPPYLEAH